MRPEWRLILDGAHDGLFNMAADAYLLENSERPTLRLYGWNSPWISLGYAQRQPTSSFAAFPVVRRPSGGRALLHAAELTYCIVLPQCPSDWSISQAFEHLTSGLGAALLGLGVEVHRATTSLPPGRQISCMALQQQGELHSERGKLVGSAQVRRGSRLLQHGSLPIRVDQELLQRAFPGHPPCWGLEDLGYTMPSSIQLADSLAEVWKLDWQIASWSEAELEAIRG
jgi:lipoate-protein ligase A